MKRAFTILSIALVLLALEASAESLGEHYQYVSPLKPHKAKKAGHPMLHQASVDGLNTNQQASNLFAVLLNDILNLFANPGSQSVAILLTDLGNFIMMPMIGGLMLTSVTYNFDVDPVTYHNAQMTKADMYSSQMKLAKTSVYKMIGKENFLADATYIPPADGSFNSI